MAYSKESSIASSTFFTTIATDMSPKHGIALFRQMALEFKAAIDAHNVCELERLGREFIAEIDHKTKQFAHCGTGTSEAKRRSAAVNGTRGGRPKKMDDCKK